MSQAPLYDTIGRGYRNHRRPDPRIARQVQAALGGAGTLLNVGAGAGSYEPEDRPVVALDPSDVQLRQRPRGAAAAVRGVAEHLPFAAALAVLTVHHWRDLRSGLRELQRVARERVVLLSWDTDSPGFWLTRDYFPDLVGVDRETMPAIRTLVAGLRGRVDMRPVPIPWDCTDGFLGAYWRRPEEYLDAERRSAISIFSRLPAVEARIARLRADLADGTWHTRNADLLAAGSLDLGYRLVVCELDPA